MRICGVDLVGSEAVICLLFLDKQQFSLPECRVRKLTLPKDHSRGDLQYFEESFAKLMSDYKVDKVAIRELKGTEGFKFNPLFSTLMLESTDLNLYISPSFKPTS